MAHYRKIDTRIWNDQKFMSLGDDAKLLFFLILTHPNLTMLGAMRNTIGGLSDELGWTQQRLAEGLAEGLNIGLVKWSPEGRLIWLPNFLKYNPIENPNQLTAAIGALDLLPECQLKSDVNQSLIPFTDRFRKGLGKGLGKGLAEGLPNQEQEQEQEQDINQKRKSQPSVGTAKKIKLNTKKQDSTGDRGMDRCLEAASRLLVAAWPTEKSNGEPMPRASSSQLRRRFVALVAEGKSIDHLRAIGLGILNAYAYRKQGQDGRPLGPWIGNIAMQAPQHAFGVKGIWPDFEDAKPLDPLPESRIAEVLGEKPPIELIPSAATA